MTDLITPVTSRGVYLFDRRKKDEEYDFQQSNTDWSPSNGDGKGKDERYCLTSH